MRFPTLTFNFIRRCGVLLLAVFPFSGIAAAERAAAAHPDVLFIIADDLNDWVGFLGGHPQARTPNLDRLAERGQVFTRAYCAAPLCNPSRASVMTGLHPTTSGVYTNRNPWRTATAAASTIPEWFGEHGYRTAASGKTIHSTKSDDLWDEQDPGARTFRLSTELVGDPADESEEDASAIVLGALPIDDDAMGDHGAVSWAVERLLERKQGEAPLFLACGIVKPHLPWEVPAEYFDLFPPESVVLPMTLAEDLDDVPLYGRGFATDTGFHATMREPGLWKSSTRAYLASIAFMDAQVGRLLDALDASGRADNTIIVFWSDHGFMLGEKEHWKKWTLWERATRVPLIIAAPGVHGPGVRYDDPVSLIDLYPTLTELCGIPSPPWLDGDSLVPVLREPVLRRPHPVLTSAGPRNNAVRDARWRYIRYLDGGEELYDTWSDPHEWRNLAQLPGFGAQLESMRRWLPADPAKPHRE